MENVVTKKQVEPVDKLNDVFDQFKEFFAGSMFHNTLWQIMINENFAGKVAAFTLVVRDGFELGIACANERGYTPTTAIFAEGIVYKEAIKIVDQLNKIIFNVDKLAALDIVSSSMRLS